MTFLVPVQGWLILYVFTGFILPAVHHVLVVKRFQAEKAKDSEKKLESKYNAVSIAIAAAYVAFLFIPAFIRKSTGEERAWRSIVALCAFHYFIRSCETMFIDKYKHLTLGQRMIHIAIVFQDSTTRMTPKSTWLRGLLSSMFWGAFSIGGIKACEAIIGMRTTLPEILGSTVMSEGLVALSGGFHLMFSLMCLDVCQNFVFRLLTGDEVAPIMRNPLASRSLQSFWGLRWNSTMQSLFRQYIYAPLRRYLRVHPVIAVFVVFFVSGLWHTLPLLLAGLHVQDALQMQLYFLLQALLTVSERIIFVRKWPRFFQHVWTIGSVVVPGFLFVQPVLGLGNLDV